MNKAAPDNARQSRGTLVGAVCATAVVLVVLATVAAVALFGKPTATAGAPVPDPDHRAAVTVPAPPGSDKPAPTPTTGEPTTREPEPNDADAALAELKGQADDDRQAVEALDDLWVPQLSAKRPGLVAKGVRYDYVEILRDFRTTQDRYPEALLLYSGDYSSFRYGDFWITIEPLPYADGVSANGWCDGQGIPVDDCYAKMISHTVGYEGATLLRG
ncbi:MAG TPA: hypothetical protein VH969_16635 [Actinophytocola sp.]|jgi:serine/threonine-protein kinase|uniref:hypothetical protein n=1 Tax=Actinophytocola sp. TaxID=1872138 RepID=UPI002F94A18B